MSTVQIQVIDKRLYGFGLPDYATKGAAAIDLRAMFEEKLRLEINPGQTVLIPTGIAINMPENMAALLLPRSGLGHNHGIILGNTVGLVDEDYNKQVFVSCWNRSNEPFVINLGDRIAQMMFVPVIKPTFEIVDGFDDNGRGGFGHSGIK
jgi:dUTP pyrophosphatase